MEGTADDLYFAFGDYSSSISIVSRGRYFVEQELSEKNFRPDCRVSAAPSDHADLLSPELPSYISCKNKPSLSRLALKMLASSSPITTPGSTATRTRYEKFARASGRRVAYGVLEHLEHDPHLDVVSDGEQALPVFSPGRTKKFPASVMSDFIYRVQIKIDGEVVYWWYQMHGEVVYWW